MLSKNYKNIDALREFITQKINNSKEIDNEYKSCRKMNNSLNISAWLCTGISVYYFVYKLFILSEYTLLPMGFFALSAAWAGLVWSFRNSLNVRWLSTKIEYTHDDFNTLSKILSKSEMHCFMQEMDTPKNNLIEWKKFLQPEILPQNKICNENVDMRKVNRDKYIDSLYKETSE